MNYPQLLEKLRNKTINIIDNGHSIDVDYLCDRLESKYERLKKKPDGDPFLNTFESDIIPGEWLLDMADHYCGYCQSPLVFVLVSDDEILCTSFENYNTVVENSGDKNNYIFKKEDSEVCEWARLGQTDKLVSKINVPSGKLVLQNYFNNEEIYRKKDKYSEPTINSIMGRHVLMQELAEKNIGYGQTGNMGLEIYSNGKDILILESRLDSYLDNKTYFDENPIELDKMNDDFKKNYSENEKLMAFLRSNSFEKKGTISCSVWRWQCADKAVLETYNEIPNTNAITIDIPIGNYTIEHYYDFSDGPIVSKISLS